jgi:uncharacterized membrane protein YraQ (UPF0718 family)
MRPLFVLLQQKILLYDMLMIVLNFIANSLSAAWHLLLESSIYILFGLLISGLLRVFLSPNSVARHLGQGRFKPVLKAAFLGIPIPL